MSYWAPRITSLAVLASATLLLSACGDNGEDQQQEMPPPPVTVSSVERTSVDIKENYAGRVRGAREVDVRPRVEGVLEERLHEEGKLVEEGDALFRIDPEPFEVALEQTRAERQSAQADLNQAEREWNRVSRLYEQNAVSERERDTAQSAFELSKAALAVAESGVRRAELELSYTEVKAPLTGVTGMEALSEGNLVDRGTQLTHITQMDPVHVRFALPEDDATIQRQARRAMSDAESGDHSREATLILPDGSEYEHSGEIDFTASTVDPSTGNVSARAVFTNEGRAVVPGQFVRVRVTLETLDNVILVPERAVGDSPEGLRVYVVDDEGHAHSRPIETGRVVDGKMIVLEGLEPGERVVVNGMVGIRRDGQPVDAFDNEEAMEEAQQQEAAEAEQQGGEG